jgi:hypothetical protein
MPDEAAARILVTGAHFGATTGQAGDPRWGRKDPPRLGGGLWIPEYRAVPKFPPMSVVGLFAVPRALSVATIIG